MHAHQMLPRVDDPMFAEILGNDKADEHAKLALLHHPAWSQNELEQAEDMLGMFETFVKHVAQSLAKFVSHPDNCKSFVIDGVRNKKPPRKKCARMIGPSHTWYWVGGSRVWRCMSCLKSVPCLSAGAALKPCALQASKFVDLLANPRGHELICAEVLDGPRFVIACAVCGAWATTIPKGLMHACTGVLLPHRARDRTNLRIGRLPTDYKVEVGHFFPIAV